MSPLLPRIRACALILVAVLAWGTSAPAQTDPLPSWNDGAAKQAIVAFVRTTTDESSPEFVPAAERIAAFDQDGTLWVSHPIFTGLVFSVDRVPAVVAARPELAHQEPFKSVLAEGRDAAARLSLHEIMKILPATLTGMSVEQYAAEVAAWLDTARHPRWQRPYTDLTYLPMQELLTYLRAHGYRTYIVTGGGQDFVRVYAGRVYGIPPEQIIGTAQRMSYGYDADGKPVLTRDADVLLRVNEAGKAEGIHLVIGRRPQAAFGNSTGDRDMLEYTSAGEGARLAMLVLHDDDEREYAYGPAESLPDTHIGRFSHALYDEAKMRGWIVISMKNDWNRIFAFED